MSPICQNGWIEKKEGIGSLGGLCHNNATLHSSKRCQYPQLQSAGTVHAFQHPSWESKAENSVVNPFLLYENRLIGLYLVHPLQHTSTNLTSWWLSPTPLKNDGVRQLGLWHSQDMESCKFPWFQSPLISWDIWHFGQKPPVKGDENKHGDRGWILEWLFNKSDQPNIAISGKKNSCDSCG